MIRLFLHINSLGSTEGFFVFLLFLFFFFTADSELFVRVSLDAACCPKKNNKKKTNKKDSWQS